MNDFEEGPASEAGIDQLRRYGLSDRDASAMRAGNVTVLASQRQEAQIAKERLMRDPAFVAAYMAGGQKEQARMLEVNLRLSAQVVAG